MITARSLEKISGVRHAFFTRQGGVSKGVYASLNCSLGSNDDLIKVKANRTRAMAALGFAGAQLLTASQVHSAAVLGIDESRRKSWDKIKGPKADGLATRLPGVVLGVLTADCAPVLFASAKCGVVGAAHAGWRGAKEGILEATVAAMIKLGAEASSISAAIGPCIAHESYEVADGFFASFMAENVENHAYFAASAKPGRYLFNLQGYAAGRLGRLGLASVETSSFDTFTDSDNFFSYRRAVLKGERDYGCALSAIALLRNSQHLKSAS